jgi:hypothetical protein
MIISTDTGKRAPLAILRVFLSPSNMRSPASQKHTANIVVCVNQSAASTGKLQVGRISSLISLFGSLSVPDKEKQSGNVDSNRRSGEKKWDPKSVSTHDFVTFDPYRFEWPTRLPIQHLRLFGHFICKAAQMGLC